MSADEARGLSRLADRHLPRRRRRSRLGLHASPTSTRRSASRAQRKRRSMPCVDLLHARDRRPAADGRAALAEAIEAVDAATRHGPAYYMINCAHPTHFDHVLDGDAAWMQRVRGIARQLVDAAATPSSTTRPSSIPATRRSSAQQYGELLRRFPHINVLGGCCGTDHRHVGCISTACRKAA